MDYEIKLIELPDHHTLSMRTTTAVEDLPKFLGKAYNGIMQYMTELGKGPSGMPFAAYYNLNMKALEIEAGFPVESALPAKGEILSNIIPAAKFATTIHRGSYDTMVPAYEALNNWINANNYEATGVAYEYYLNDPNSDPSVVAETEIRFPLK